MVAPPVVAAGPVLLASECAPVGLGVGLVMVLGAGVGVVCEKANSTTLVGVCSNDGTSATGVDGGGGEAAFVTVGGSPEVLSVGAWPGVTVAPAVGRTVTVDASAAPVDVTAVAVCPCARVMGGFESRGKAEECCHLYKALSRSLSPFNAKGKLRKLAFSLDVFEGPSWFRPVASEVFLFSTSTKSIYSTPLLK